MLKILLIIAIQVIALYAYEVSNHFLGMHGISQDRAFFEIESSFDFRGCGLDINIQKANKINFHKGCSFIKDKKYGSLVCTEDGTRCLKRGNLVKEMLKELNGFSTWYVYGVRSDDTLSIRTGPGSKFTKIYNLPYNAVNLKVLDIKMNGKTTWYMIKYKNITGWVSSKYLKIGDK
jgi:hypothetical protein